jgi:Holliday junction resolvase RusA-like endonuclease
MSERSSDRNIKYGFEDSGTFFVPGIPVAKGSARAFYNKKAGKAFAVQTNAAKQKPWASMISVTAQEYFKTPFDKDVPVVLTLEFLTSRPRSHYRTGKIKNLLRPDAPDWNLTKRPGDLDKLERCVLDALTGIVYVDDAQVCIINSRKRYSDSTKTGVNIAVEIIQKDE